MRTTLDIDDDVLQAIREIARRRNRTAGSVISELARIAMTGGSKGADSVAEAPAFYGFRPMPAAGRVISNETVDQLRDQEAI